MMFISSHIVNDTRRLGFVLAPVLFCLIMVASRADAGPPLADLPQVKMPAVHVDRPRLVFRPDGSDGPRTFAALKTLCQSDERMRSILKPWLDRSADYDHSPAAAALRYRLTGDEAAAERAIRQMLNRDLTKIAKEYYSDGWEHALAYDWLYDHPSITRQKRRIIEGYLVANVRRALELLNDESWNLEPSLWHGRTKIANHALVIVLSLETAPQTSQLRGQIVRFFGDACRALQISEGWPEGYAYWLGNRAFPFALAVDCWGSATGKQSVAGIDLIELIRRTGFWHIYGLRPDNKFLLYGDIFQGVLINYSFRAQAMDYYARITGDPHLQAFALHGHKNASRPYRNRYRWVAALALAPTLPLPPGSTIDHPFAGFGALPHADLFGAGAYNLAIFRSGWAPDSTMISFRAGAVQVHHAHYNAGTFTIYNQAPLAILSGSYTSFGSPHRQEYYIRSVAANCPLIMVPGERLATRFHCDRPTVSSGGQRLVLPGGSDVASTAEWRRRSQAGKELAAGRIIAFAHQPGRFGYVAADLTCAYNSTLFRWADQAAKLRRAVRALVYLPQHQTVLVYDRIESTSAKYRKKWLLHSQTKPDCANATVIRGTADDGILQTTAKDFTVTNSPGMLAVRALLPEQSRWLLVGGPKHRFYIEDDGDQSDGFDGRNVDKRVNTRSYFDLGNWRAELEPTRPAKSDDFLVALAIGSGEHPPTHQAAIVGRGQRYVACQIKDTIVVISDMAGSAEAVSVELAPLRPATGLIACAIVEPQPIGLDRFTPITPPDCATWRKLDPPLPAGQPESLRLELLGGRQLRILPSTSSNRP